MKVNLPQIIKDLVKAQNNADQVTYANCFSETAIVSDEGKTHNGRNEIEHWITEANEKYKTVMKPVSFEENGITGILKAEVSGIFPGSPAILNYHFEFKEGVIQSLKITG